MNKINKPSIKNEFLYLYRNQIKYISIFILIFISIFISYKIIDFFVPKYSIYNKIFLLITIFWGIFFCYYTLILIYNLFCYILNQRRIPLTKKELKDLNITTQKEYISYLYTYLHKIRPSSKIIYQILLSFYQNFSNGVIIDDSKVSSNENKKMILQWHIN